MIRKILEAYRIAEARGHFQNTKVTPMQATMATILEAGAMAAQKAYFGDKTWNAVANDVQANRQGYEDAAQLQEALLRDISRPMRVLREAHTTTDFPLILANIRSQVLRETLNPVQSMFWDFAEKRVATDFKVLKAYRVSTGEELVLRPEGEDVELTTISMTGDGYAVANYERGVRFTWEMFKNDDLGVFKMGLKNLGMAARRTRAKVALRAVAAINPTTLGGSAGGPTIDRIAALIQVLAEKTSSDTASLGEALDLSLTDIVFGAKWKITAAESLKSQYVLGPVAAKNGAFNAVFGAATPHEERIMASVLGSDWIGFDNTHPWLEVATLDDFAAGPLTYTQMADVEEHPDQGSFDNHSNAVKLGDAVAAKVTNTDPVVRVLGA